MKKLIYMIIMIFLIGSYIYIQDDYEASYEASSIVESEDHILSSKDYHVFEAKDPIAGLIFYPGAKVDYVAYSALMDELSHQGVTCILLKMPFNIAFLGQNKANGWMGQYPEIQHWYLAGHSLGGVCAGNYLKKHTEDFDGLILLASYTTCDLSDDDLQILSIYGNQDGVLNLEQYERAKSNYPANFKEMVIEGGNHANFGDYGCQKKDGIATITKEKQLQETIDEIIKMIQEKNS